MVGCELLLVVRTLSVPIDWSFFPFGRPRVGLPPFGSGNAALYPRLFGAGGGEADAGGMAATAVPPFTICPV